MEQEWHDRQKQLIEINDLAAKNRLTTFYNQENMNIEITGICDVFDLHAEKAIGLSSSGVNTSGELINNKNVKRYRRYQDLLAAKDIDAVIIATPDFHHAQMTIDTVNAGKHVYVEKAMTLTARL